ncbi:aminotransferase class I/II-fold pyridoxal phosphate-dependent enzyme [Ruminiclostridium herbifermentans]|uniref:Aminotransferase class I/II-fold pyridoxal phosphate-dependent enzyme n=1 Tax=Ruminiclostridium herbifermentans TaxID=2488810 RepID=A0A4U7JHY4_9FIRM|nr:DegT/DnrJ/EryC1/StrS family aminotransferase [Ruminiclostridium herbifermentans]QNU66224.1 aminotransferase class I/II-fold pyridoxal phosphate-dependent enzyme [Ruminiclostridium herbifermentans]
MGYDIRDFLVDFTSEEEIINNLRKKLCEYFNCQHSILVTNGTSAIEIVLKSLQLPRGAGVIVPDISFIATATSVANCGLLPVYCDIDTNHFGMSINSLKQIYNDQIKAVILVHFGGFVNRDIFEIKEFCKEKGIFLIEDCAQAFGCTIDNKRVGTIGDAGTFSFQSSKIVNSGEGGLIVTNSADLAGMCEAISNWGISFNRSKRNVNIPSSNYRMSSIQCYFIMKQMNIISEIMEERLSKYHKMSKDFQSHGINVVVPKEEKDIFEYPFFLPIESTNKINTIEPRMETPMRKSSIVKSILKTFYPDLFCKYKELNAKQRYISFNSDLVINKIDFINISNVNEDDISCVIKQYIG